jgi:hypothetical protein
VRATRRAASRLLDDLKIVVLYGLYMYVQWETSVDMVFDIHIEHIPLISMALVLFIRWCMITAAQKPQRYC